MTPQDRKPPRAERIDVTFSSGKETCAAWLYRPASMGPAPVIVMAHGLGGVKEMRLDAFAERFVAEGYACLVFDYRHFGASTGEPRQLLDIKSQIADWAAAVRFARSIPELDPERVVVWGTSFGGGHAILTAANDARIAAAIAQCPFTDGLAALQAVPLRTSARVTARAVRDTIGHLLGRSPVMIPTSGPPGSTALMTAPDAMPGYLALVPGASSFENQVAARVGLAIGLHTPGRATPRITCPILFAICETDSVAPASAAQRHATKAPEREIRLYPEGHFDIYVGEAFERVVADQIEFLSRHVPAAS
ncbi:alpha/beta hydrolase [Nocardioides gansuensis]|uniref:Alpha/beta hydrolase n=1 Tax=Nocardioides gansuensis TaxID=2138300 RepID=A0A2T8FDL4_9ACTN|nr:alpha/beta fold hydrolase [Nocardioides gansuensis]PVG83802.1 alpha/beta hydrolase [Nocardioides gansuensis]